MSACLLGRACRFDTEARVCPHALVLRDAGCVRLIPVCPETAGGLGTPRPPAAVVGGDGRDVIAGRAAVMTREGADVTRPFLEGVRETILLARYFQPAAALLKERSPACGFRTIHDGHSGRLRPGPGVFAARLEQEFPGLRILTEEDLTRRPLEELRAAAWNGIPPEWARGHGT